MNDDKIHEQIGNSIKQLNIHDTKSYSSNLKNMTTESVNSLVKIGDLPLLTIGSCSCGCGQLNLHVNGDLVTKQQSMNILGMMYQSMKQEMEKLN